MATINLGWIKSIKRGSTPPTNLEMLWYDTNLTGSGIKIKYYDEVLGLWLLTAIDIDNESLQFDSSSKVEVNRSDDVNSNSSNILASTALTNQLQQLITPNTTYRNIGHIPLSQKGATDGVATLGSDTRIPAAQMPLTPTFDQITLNNAATMPSGAVRLDQLNSAILGQHWQTPADDILSTPPTSPVLDSRYIINPTGTGAWAGHDNEIAQWNGADWDFTTPQEGWTLWVRDVDTNYNYNGTAWVEFGTTVTHNNLTGLQGGQAGEYYHLTAAQHAAAITTPTLQTVTVAGATSDQDLILTGGISSTASGSNSERFGDGALANVVALDGNGFYNTAFGKNALNSLNNGFRNTAFGEAALQSATTASSCSAFGRFALGGGVLTGSNNSAFGISALASATSGANNDAFGNSALGATTTGESNCAFGGTTMSSNTTGSFNSAFGRSALSQNREGTNNTAIGFEALRNSRPTSGTMDNSTAVGYQAGINQQGDNNLFLGYRAGYHASNITSFTNSVAIGANSNIDASNQIVFGDANVTEIKTAASFNSSNASPIGSAPGGTNVPSGSVLRADGSGGSSWQQSSGYETFVVGTYNELTSALTSAQTAGAGLILFSADIAVPATTVMNYDYSGVTIDLGGFALDLGSNARISHQSSNDRSMVLFTNGAIRGDVTSTSKLFFETVTTGYCRVVFDDISFDNIVQNDDASRTNNHIQLSSTTGRSTRIEFLRNIIFTNNEDISAGQLEIRNVASFELHVVTLFNKYVTDTERTNRIAIVGSSPAQLADSDILNDGSWDVVSITGSLAISEFNLYDFTSGTPTLQQVTTAGASTTDGITIGDTLNLGAGTNTVNKTIFANNGDASKPAIRYNETTNAWQFSDDGSIFTNFGGGAVASLSPEVTDTYRDYTDHLTVTGIIGSDVMQGLTYFNGFWYWGQNLGAGVNGRIYKINATTGAVDSNFAGPPHAATGDVREDHNTMIWGSGGDDVPAAWEIDGNGTLIRQWTFTGTTYNRGGAVVYVSENKILLYSSSNWNFDLREVTINDDGTWVYGSVVATGTRSMGRPQGFDYKDGFLYYLCDEYNIAADSADETVKVIYKLRMPDASGPVEVVNAWKYQTGTTFDEAEGLTFVGDELYFGAHDSKKIRQAHFPTTSRSVTTNYLHIGEERLAGISLAALIEGDVTSTGVFRGDNIWPVNYRTLSGTSVSMNASTSLNAIITLSAATTTINMSGLVSGMSGNIIVNQDATGGRLLAITPTPKVINGGGGNIPLTSAANARDIVSWTYDGTNLNVNVGPNYT